MPHQPRQRDCTLGKLPVHKQLAFLEQYYASRPQGPFQPPTLKSKKRGEIFYLRAQLRAKYYPGWRIDNNAIREIMATKVEWTEWLSDVREEKDRKLDVIRAKKGKTAKVDSPPAEALGASEPSGSRAAAVTVWVTSLDTRSERKFDLHLTIEQLKNKFELFTGIPAQNQQITLHNSENDAEVVATLDDDSKALGFYGVRNWQMLKVTDLNPSVSFTGQLTDVTQVDKFELSEDAYAQRQDTVMAYKQRNKIGRFADKDAAPSKPLPPVDIAVGSRCEVETTVEAFHKRGTVRFVGPTKFGSGDGTWVGIEYDEPIGKNDGSVQGERYFTCKPNFGVFVRPDRVKVGDFPVEEIDFSDEEM
ncbi:hypothetical protein EIP91_012435 [Steccherinum ochraceum]|uniref:CAP-Gly domain-containing protein n=1 Tax=Steccherinum ochraceum TaxID=92696 RepID=A0A4R0RG94_9APHY|nr:hypothetical protein EIP91_012435 [Steccherinum ochraceum]